MNSSFAFSETSASRYDCDVPRLFAIINPDTAGVTCAGNAVRRRRRCRRPTKGRFAYQVCAKLAEMRPTDMEASALMRILARRMLCFNHPNQIDSILDEWNSKWSQDIQLQTTAAELGDSQKLLIQLLEEYEAHQRPAASFNSEAVER